MKNINLTKIKKHMLLILYIAVLLIIIANGIFNFVLDMVNIPQEKTLTLNDFTYNQLEITGEDTIVATGDDPYMVYEGNGEKLRTVYYSLKQDANGTICAYYAKQGEDFSNRKRLFPSFGEYSEAFYVFPQSDVEVIRIDLGNETGADFTFDEIVLNRQIPFFSYFALSQRELLIAAVFPLLIYCILQFIKQAVHSLKSDKKGGGSTF